jgi:hypothetical protein
VLAVLLPILAGAVTWLVADATVSTQACSTGAGGGLPEAAAFAALVLAAPTAVVWHARHARPFLAEVAVPVVVCVLLAVPLLYFGAQIWWVGHNCVT